LAAKAAVGSVEVVVLPLLELVVEDVGVVDDGAVEEVVMAPTEAPGRGRAPLAPARRPALDPLEHNPATQSP
jgi:hypothetical protein